MGGQRHEWTGVGLFVDRCLCKQSVSLNLNLFVLVYFLVFCWFPSLFSNNFINQQIILDPIGIPVVQRFA
jgi:hypothetical protein